MSEPATDTVPETPTTGHPDVDAVLASVTGLEDRPIAEQVEVFTDAHERLRQVLTGAGDGPAVPAAG